MVWAELYFGTCLIKIYYHTHTHTINDISKRTTFSTMSSISNNQVIPNSSKCMKAQILTLCGFFLVLRSYTYMFPFLLDYGEDLKKKMLLGAYCTKYE